MSGQPQSQFFPTSAVVKDLETKLVIPSKSYHLASSYQQLCQDPVVVLAVRYLALGAISNKLNLYSSQHSQSVSVADSASSLANEISGHMKAADPTHVLASIQHLKAYYPPIYRLNTLLFDQAAANAAECIDRIPIQDRNREAMPATESSSVFASRPSAAEQYTIPNQNFTQSQSTVSKYAPSPRNNTIVVGACLLASAILAGVFFTLDRSNTSQAPTVVASPRSAPTVAVASSPLPIAPAATAPSSFLPVSPSIYSPTPISTTSVSPPAVSNHSVAPIPITSNQSASQRPLVSSKVTAQNNSPDSRSSVSPMPTTKISSSSSSSEVDNSSPAQRPSANNFISQYYGKLKNGQHQSAWLDLAPSFQHNRQANPGGYNGEYSKWWGGLGKRTQIDKVETIKSTAEQAIVQVHCQLSGESYIAEYYLAFDNASRSWKISQIKKLS